MGVSAPSLHIESTDSMIVECYALMASGRGKASYLLCIECGDACTFGVDICVFKKTENFSYPTHTRQRGGQSPYVCVRMYVHVCSVSSHMMHILRVLYFIVFIYSDIDFNIYR